MNLLHIAEDFFSLIYPSCCEACSGKLYSGETFICSRCWYHLPKTGFHINRENPLTRLFWGRTLIETGAALFYYDKGGKVQKLVHRIKYQGGKSLAHYLGKRLGCCLLQSGHYAGCDCIIPVPLHEERLKKRGFNQSELIGKGLEEVMGIAINTRSLMKQRPTQTQTRKRRFMRWENVEAVFELDNAETIRHKHVLLVDDVITTGATVESCVTKLLQAEGVRVSVAAIGVTV